MLIVITCACGSVDSLVRNFLKSIRYENWMTIPIAKGKEKSLSMVNLLPPSAGKRMLQSFLKNASKWAVIVGYDEDECRWSDIAHNGEKSRIEAEVLVDYFK